MRGEIIMETPKKHTASAKGQKGVEMGAESSRIPPRISVWEDNAAKRVSV